MSQGRRKPPKQEAEPARRAPAPRSMIYVIPLGILLVVALLVGFSVVNQGDGETGGDDPAAPNNVDREAERLQAEFAERDRRQVEDLTGTARRASERLVPVLEEMATYLPPGGEPAADVADPETIEGWKGAVRAADREFGDPPSGETATNVARGSLDVAVDTLGSAVRSYEAAADLPPEERSAVLERASEGRDLAVRTWSIGATQLDAVNIESGYGHQHVFLPANGVGGALTADPEPEGSGAEER